MTRILYQAELCVWVTTNHKGKIKIPVRWLQTTEVLSYKVNCIWVMFRWVGTACDCFFPCGSLAGRQSLFKVAACLFLTFTSSATGSFSALFLDKYQFEIAGCLYFPQLVNHQIFWSMPVSCSWRLLSCETVVTMVKKHQVGGKNYMREFQLPQKLTQILSGHSKHSCQ